MILLKDMDNTNQTFSSHLCSHCGGPAPEWKCPECGFSSPNFDPLHFQKCEGTMMQAQCQKCGEAESKCECTSVSE